MQKLGSCFLVFEISLGLEIGRIEGVFLCNSILLSSSIERASLISSSESSLAKGKYCTNYLGNFAFSESVFGLSRICGELNVFFVRFISA